MPGTTYGSGSYGSGTYGGVSTGPVLTAISPTSAPAGSTALTLTATGSGFLSGTVVTWNGTPLTTAYVSATTLTATIPAADLTTPGTATVNVQ